MTSLFKLKKENKGIKYILFRDIKNLFKHEEEGNYDKLIRVNSFLSNIYIECKSNRDINKRLSVEEYLIKMHHEYLNKSDTQKIQLIIANIFISSLDYDEEYVMHSRNDNIEIVISNEADEVIEELFDSLKNRYKNNLESIKDSEFVFDYVQLFHYKRHKIN